ncbi:hypothetical protein Gorai_019647 [Gossypium raimondii]|uniref:Diphthine--ammonia ligase n=1 Tax=Gossypium raimondii TaxID=29730 RepID=A0A7J8PP45_GOSRA|nr:hypothetical protein [Gossypium raimondii]
MYQTVSRAPNNCKLCRMHGSSIVPKANTRIHKASPLNEHHKLSYQRTPGDEVEDMFILLNEVKKQIPSVTAVSSGAIASDYQRLRVESVCSRLGLVSLAYLWKQDQSLLLQEMVICIFGLLCHRLQPWGWTLRSTWAKK